LTLDGTVYDFKLLTIEFAWIASLIVRKIPKTAHYSRDDPQIVISYLTDGLIFLLLFLQIPMRGTN